MTGIRPLVIVATLLAHHSPTNPSLKLPFRLLSRARYNALKSAASRGKAGAAFIERLSGLFDVDGAEPKLLRTDFVRGLADTSPAAVLDIGANAGLWTRCLAARFPAAVVHAVEADPRTAATLRSNVAGLANVTVHQCAVHSSAGTIRFRSHQNPLLSSVLELDDAVGATTVVEVEAVTLDELVHKRLGVCPTLMKVDTEGNDMQVLAGGKATLADPRLRAVVMEFGFDESTRRQVVLGRLLDMMATAGFRLRDLDLAGVYQDALYGNALFCRFEG